ncbi:MAG: alpha/beta hydrolase [Deltaproteobacteria bacterium]|nr:alpha/beta hydrolase [Deltaproteobacteria bacterium]MBI4374194.1 alpha/beta hydrolase [Deltaproteobacteria bacterium]
MVKKKTSAQGRLKLFQIRTVKEGYAKSLDGTEIYFHSIGNGKIPIICCNGLGVSTFFWVYLERHFKETFQVVTWDYRGHGKSFLKKNTRNFTLKALTEDLRAVLKALKIKKGIFIGHSMGTQLILEFYRRHPKSVLAIISCLGYYGHPMDYFFNISLSPLLFRLVYFLGTTFPKQANLISRLFLLWNPLASWMGGILKVMNTGMINREDMNHYVDHLVSVEPILFSTLLKSSQENSAEDILSRIKVPTLILAGEDDQFTPAWISRKMHRLVPKSELLTIHRATHAGLVEQPDVINLRIEKFINERLRIPK